VRECLRGLGLDRGDEPEGEALGRLSERPLTEVLIGGQSEPLYVAERAEEIARRIG